MAHDVLSPPQVPPYSHSSNIWIWIYLYSARKIFSISKSHCKDTNSGNVTRPPAESLVATKSIISWGMRGFSTVWLPRDKESVYQPGHSRPATANMTPAEVNGARWRSWLRIAKLKTRKTLWWKYFLAIYFSAAWWLYPDGPTGIHQCLVFELLGLIFDMVLTDYSEGNISSGWKKYFECLRSSWKLLNLFMVPTCAIGVRAFFPVFFFFAVRQNCT